MNSNKLQHGWLDWDWDAVLVNPDPPNDNGYEDPEEYDPCLIIKAPIRIPPENGDDPRSKD